MSATTCPAFRHHLSGVTAAASLPPPLSHTAQGQANVMYQIEVVIGGAGDVPDTVLQIVDTDRQVPPGLKLKIYRPRCFA